MNKKRAAAVIIAAVVILGLIAFFGYSPDHEGTVSQNNEAGVSGEQIPAGEDGAASAQDGSAQAQNGAASGDNVYQTAPDAGIYSTNPSGSVLPAPVSSGDQKEDLQKTLMNSNNLYYYGKVQNDITGKWRYAGYTSTVAQEELALDYYNAFFESDDEIHALINYAAGNTARITVLDENTLDVTILEHIEGEEQNADTLFNGRVLVKFWVYKDTGQITEIKPD